MPTLLITFLLATTGMLFVPALSANNEIVVYSSRNKDLIQPILDEYSRLSHTPVRLLNGNASALIEQLEQEAQNPKADMIILSDAGDLWLAAQKNLLSPVDSDTLISTIPAAFRDTENRWFALSKRARAIVYHSDRVDTAQINSYTSLANPEWKGRLCLQTSRSSYNQSLVAMLIQRMGIEKAETIVRGWVNNLATAPLIDDSTVMKRIAAGQCDAGIVNSYYFARFTRQQPDTALSLLWPDQNAEGVHVNISGAGITANAPNRQQAIDLLEWLTTKKAQSNFAGFNMEYPINPKVYPVRAVAKLGRFKSDENHLMNAGKLQQEAIMLMKRAGYK